MLHFLRFTLSLFLIAPSAWVSAQTVLMPGDLMVLAYATDLGACGLPAEADEISFVCFTDIETGTTIDITDNGWEHSFAGFWGDSEGTIRMTRTGGTITRGTVITFQGWLNAGVWTYRVISPDNQWTFTNLNVPGGPLNMDNGMAGVGGDQVYFMQGGEWDNQGGGTNRATYDGRLLWAFNTNDVWNADGTVNGSNLHPDVTPCYYSQGATNPWFMNFGEYTGPTSGTYWDGDSEEDLDHFGYLYLVSSPAYWTTYELCAQFMANGPSYVGFSIDIVENMELTCFFCGNGCAPYDQLTGWTLPEDGEYNITYSVGGEIFTVMGAQDGDQLWIPITEDVEVAIISIEKVGGCTVYSKFSDPFVVDAIAFNAGVFTEIWICDNYPFPLPLFLVLEGDPEPGGIWYNEGVEMAGGIWVPSLGPGDYTYLIPHEHGSPCMPPYDSATVRIHTIGLEESIIEVSCDQNGTPNDIFDDVLVFTLTVISDGFGPDYMVTVPGGGTVTPVFGTAGIPQTFSLWPGSATEEPNITINIRNLHPEHIPGWICNWPLELESPGFCSDPCDYEMATEISGPNHQDVCIGNCPEDDPVTFTIETEGGTEPYKMDFSVSAPSFATWNFNAIAITPYEEFEVCVDNVPAPTFNVAANLLTIPAFLAGSEVAITLGNVFDKYDCTANIGNEEIYLTIHDLPELDTLKLEFCSEFATLVDLTQYDEDINPFYDVIWYDGNPLGAGELIQNPAFANLTNVGELWAYVKDDYCENSIRVDFKIHPSPKIDTIPPVELCTGSAVTLQSLPIEDLGNSMATYTFHTNPPLDSSTILDPAFYLPPDSTTVYLLATATGMCYDTMPIDINVQDYPNFSLQATPCDLLNDTYSVVLTSSADSIWASIGTVDYNIPGPHQITGIPNNVNVTIELLSTGALCKDTFLITAPNCDCPFINQPVAAQPTYEICEGSPVPTLTVTVNPGLIANWYTVPAGGVAFLQNSLSYQPPSAVSANYYVEAIDPATNCYSIRTQVSLVVHPLPQLQALSDQVLCETGTVNLTALTPAVLNGVSGSGNWFTLPGNQPVSGTVLPQDGDAWYYLFTSNPGGCRDSDTMTATVHPLPTIDLYEITCDENTLTFDLLFTSDADDVVVSAGTLTQTPGTDSFSLTAIPFDTDIQFNLQNTVTGCTNSFLQQAPDCSCPALLQQTSHEACSADGNVDLGAFEGFGVNGSWELVSSPPGGNPAILAGNSLQVLDKDPGLYTLRFIRSVILANCVDTAVFSFTLHASPFADAGTDATVCAPDDILLSGAATGSNVQVSWQTTGSGTIQSPNTLNTSYTPTLADITAGSVSFTLTAADQTGFCPSAQETIDVAIDGSAYFILGSSTPSYCDTADISVDLDAFITFGTTGGHWFFPDTVSAPITGQSFFNPSTLTAGQYTVFYTTTNAIPPCGNDTASINFIIENCMCPSVALSNPSQALCSDSGTQDLNAFLITSEPGTWSVTGVPPGTNPATLNGSNFVTNQSDAGTYRLRYTLTNPVAGCDDFAEIMLDVIATPDIQVSSVECADDLQSWEVIIVTVAQNVTNSAGDLTSLGGNRYLIQNLPIGGSLQITVENGNGLCTASADIPAPDCECTLAITNLPDAITLCPDETFILQAQVSGGKGDVTEFWISGNDSLYQSDLEVSEPGVYQFITFDELGCKEEHTVDVSLYEEMIADITWSDVSCPGYNDGIIMIHSISGGTAPFSLSVNGGSPQSPGVFPYLINGLNAGNYQLDLTDALGCTIELHVVVGSASAENIDLGPDQTVLIGDSVHIQPILTFIPDSFYWTGDIDIIDPLLLDHIVAPETDKSLNLFAIDENGCVYTDDLMIRVLLTSSIYVPNVFSPNDDNINDIVAPLADPSIVRIEYFVIYSRWGDLMFSATDFDPNQPGFGWNGVMREKPAAPGVYVYRLKAVNKRGKEYFLTGDITLVR